MASIPVHQTGDFHPLPRGTPASVDVDARRIGDFLREIAARGLELHSFMLMHKGVVIAEGAWRPYELHIPHMQHSLTKSWVAAAVGLAYDDELVRLDDRVIDFFPEHLPAVVSENLSLMTVRDLLTMRTGHRSGISGGEWRGNMGSWVAAFLAEPVEERPGEHFIYGSGASYMLSAIVTKVTGRTACYLLRERILGPLGISSISWDLSPEGFSTGGNGLTCTTEDLVKFGLLHLRGGRWNGRQLLSESWMREATRNQVRLAWVGQLTDGKRLTRPTDPAALNVQPGYGYQWWMTSFGGYRAAGMFGQECIVLPKHDAVIAFTAGLPRGHAGVIESAWDHLVPALETRPDDDGAAGDVQLAEQLQALSLNDAPEGSLHSSLEPTVSGCRWRMEQNEDAVEWIQLDFTGDTCLFSLKDHRGIHQVNVGVGLAIDGWTSMTGNKLHHQYQPERMRVVAQGAWASADRFIMRWRFLGTAFRDTVECSFEGDRVRLDRYVNTNSGALERPAIFGRRLPQFDPILQGSRG